MLYDRLKVIAVDVDGTLVGNDGALNSDLVEWCKNRKAAGFSLFLWSSRGETYAKETARRFEIEYLFDHILSKPGYIVDDHGWSWINFTHVTHYWLEDLMD